jgi:hypothetical protein
MAGAIEVVYLLLRAVAQFRTTVIGLGGGSSPVQAQCHSLNGAGFVVSVLAGPIRYP